jgi:hypothetical protein
MTDCNCDGNNHQFLDVAEGCVDKVNGQIDSTGYLGIYGKATDENCVNVCQMYEKAPGYLTPQSQAIARRDCNAISFEALPDGIKNILKTFKYLILNINVPNEYTYRLTYETHKQIYEETLLSIPPTLCETLGRVKILITEGTFNSDIANIVNLYAFTLDYCLRISELGNQELRIKIEQNKHYITDAMFDFGCSMGQMSLFYQYIVLDEQLNLSVDNVMQLIRNAIMYTIERINSDSNYMNLNIPTTNIYYNYNEEYQTHYLIRLLKSCRANIQNIIPDFNILQHLNPVIIQKFNLLDLEIKRKFSDQMGGSNYKQKYLKYKQKYLNLKKLL